MYTLVRLVGRGGVASVDGDGVLKGACVWGVGSGHVLELFLNAIGLEF